MRKYVLLFFIGVFQLQVSVGQNPLVKQWDRDLGAFGHDDFSSFQQTKDGGFILAGSSTAGISGDKTQPTQGSFDNWIIKIDSIGNKQWDKDFGGTFWDYLNCIEQTFDGGYILGGWTISGVGGDKTQPNWGGEDFWVIKIDSLGNKQWDRDYGGLSNERLFSMQQTSDSGYIFGGHSLSGIGGDKTQASQGLTDFWIVKTNSLGIKQWDRRYGGNHFDELHSLRQTSDGGFILSGLSASGIGGDKSQGCWGYTDYWIVKTDSLGNKQWDKRFGGYNSDWPNWVDQTKDGGYVIGGRSNSTISGDKSDSSNGGVDYWIVKIDSQGNLQWDRDFGGVNDEYFFGNVTQTIDKGYIISGSSYSNAGGDKTENNLGSSQSWIIKTDSLGNKIWDKTVFSPGYDENSRIIQTMDGCYAISSGNNGPIGGEKSQASWTSAADYWIIKFCDSTQIMTTVAGLASSDTTFCDKQYINFYDHSTNSPTSWQWLFPGGVPSSSTQQNPLGIYYNSYGSFDVTLIACNASGCDTLYLPNFIKEFPNPPVPIITWIADTLFSTPAFSHQWYFNSNAIPGATGQYYVFQQPGDYFVIITDSNGCSTPSTLLYTGIDEVVDNGGIYVIPNPTDGNFVLYGVKFNSVVKIYDVAGRVLYSDKAKSSPQQVHFEASDGIYFIELGGIGKLNRQKIILKN